MSNYTIDPAKVSWDHLFLYIDAKRREQHGEEPWVEDELPNTYKAIVFCGPDALIEVLRAKEDPRSQRVKNAFYSQLGSSDITENDHMFTMYMKVRNVVYSPNVA